MLEGSQDISYSASWDQKLGETSKIQSRVESMGDEKCGTLSNSISTVKLRLGKKFDYLALFYVL